MMKTNLEQHKDLASEEQPISIKPTLDTDTPVHIAKGQRQDQLVEVEAREVDQVEIDRLRSTILNKPTQIDLPSFEGLVRDQSGYILEDSTFNSLDIDVDKTPQHLIRPLVTTPSDKEKSASKEITTKATPSMGKATVAEVPIQINGQKYSFIQWKGIGRNVISSEIEDVVAKVGGKVEFPCGKQGMAPLMHLDGPGIRLTRFNGAAFYEDLLLEKAAGDKIAKLGIRSPQIISTIKFSKRFCKDNNLPIPDNDDPQSDSGESMADYLDRNVKLDQKMRDQILSTDDSKDYKSAILGQNIRAFRNPLRVNELEKILKSEKDSDATIEELTQIIEFSRRILSQEFGQEFDNQQFLNKFGEILGEQAAILCNNSVLQGAMQQHKQDITLAGEICDWDCYKMTNYEDPKLYNQIFLIASHINPLLDSFKHCGIEVNESEVVKAFTTKMLEHLNDQVKNQMISLLTTNADIGSVTAISSREYYDEKDKTVKIGYDSQTKQNLSGCQPLFSQIRKGLLA